MHCMSVVTYVQALIKPHAGVSALLCESTLRHLVITAHFSNEQLSAGGGLHDRHAQPVVNGKYPRQINPALRLIFQVKGSALRRVAKYSSVGLLLKVPFARQN